MALVIPPGFAQVSIEMRNTGDPQPWFVTYGTNFSLESLDAINTASNHAQAFADTWRTFLNSSTSVRGAYLTIGSDGGNYTIYGPVRTGGTGTSTGSKLPQNCAALIRKVTSRPGRAGKGRCFLPNVLNEDQVDTVGVISPTSVTNLQTQVNLWIENLETANLDEPYFMHVLHNEGIPGGTTPSLVLALQPDSIIATQRRRLRR